MQQRIKLLEKTPITQRQALLIILALYFLGTILLIAIKFTSPVHDASILLSAAVIGGSLFGGAWFLYYRYSWEPVRYFTATITTLIVALFLPEPFVSTYAPMA